VDQQISGAALRKMREEAGFASQADFASAIGVNQGYVSRIESGKQPPGRDTLQKWLVACGRTLSVSETPALSDEQSAVLDAIDGLEVDDVYLLAEATRGLKNLKGDDYELARGWLVWLSKRAPSSAAPEETVEERLARIEAMLAGNAKKNGRSNGPG
jgi:transcriptional regulator with XRE-family HTH domain